MNSNEIYENYLKALNQREELEVKIAKYIERWENNETIFDTKTIEDVVDKGYLRLDELKQIEKDLHNEFIKQSQKEENKKAANTSVQHHLGTRPTDLEITSGLLSSNAKESHLIIQKKSKEELSNEKLQSLNEIKNKVMNKEIPLSLASKLINDINASYEFYEINNENLLNNKGNHK